MIETWLNQDLQEAVHVRYLDGNVFSMDNNGNKVGVNVFSGGEPVTLSGSISANVIRSDGATVVVSGESSENSAWVVLPQAAYAVPGVISVVIKNTVSSDVTTLGAVVANVYQSTTDTTVDPGTIIPSVQALITSIETAVASIPADYSSLWTSLAPAFSSSTSYQAGQYVTYNGGVYRFTTAHSGSWAAADATAVNVGGELYDVKSAIQQIPTEIHDGYLSEELSFSHGWINSSGVYNPSDNRYISQAIKTDDLISITNKSTSAIYIVYFSAWTSLSSFTYASYTLVNVNATVAISRTNPYIVIESNATTVAGLVGILLKKESSIDYLAYGNLGGIDFHTLENKTACITPNINILDGLTETSGKIYERTTASISDNQYGEIYPEIPISSGKTYYYKNLYAYFCVIKYSSGTKVNLSDDQGTTQNGSFTASGNGTICITTRVGKSGFVFTESQDLYNSELTNTYYVVDAQGIPKTYTVKKDGSGDFDSLVEAIEEATAHMDSIVYVGAGTWDLIDELGSDYINSVSSTKRGVYLKNRVHLIFDPKAVVQCIYEGSRADTIAWLSAFNAGINGFTLENANIVTGNIRYCVHDERDQDTDFYTNKYINCNMYHNSSYAQGGQNQCIGGGLGLNGHIIVEGCVFENPNVNNAAVVSWHNSAGSNAKSFIDVHGCYVRGSNSMRFRYYGSTPATQKTTILCHGNCLGANIGFGPETSGSTNENIELLQWNNVVRA